MRKRFNRSLLGYDPGQVDCAIKLTAEKHQAQIGQLRKELAQLTDQAAALRRTIEPLREELEEYRAMEQQLSAKLLSAHLATSNQLLQVIKETECAEETMRQHVYLKESRVAELQAHLAQLKLDVRAMAIRYAQAVTRVEVKPDAKQERAAVR